MIRLDRCLSIGLLTVFMASGLWGQPGPPPKTGLTADQVPAQLRGISIEQRLGEQIPLETEFTNASGSSVALGELVRDRPALLVPVYYDCPMLCGMVLETLTQGLKTLSLEPGRDFEVIVFSFDPSEGTELAASTRKRILRSMALRSEKRAENQAGSATSANSSDSGWHFLVGSQDSIDELNRAIGFTANRDEASGEYAHAAGLFVLTPSGVLSRVFFGLSYPPRDLRLALLEAGEGSIGSLVDQVLLYCFRYDPATGRYSTAILRLVRTAGVLTALALATYVFLTWRRTRSSRRDKPGSVEGVV